jgi:hypothetical protein
VHQTLFPGERELGAKIFYAPQMGPLSMFRADVGLFNGSGPTSNEYDSDKDLIGHLALQIPFESASLELDLGVSGYYGAVRNNTESVYRMGTLPNGQPGFVADSAQANLGSGVGRTYIGFDAQFYVDLPGIGGGILRGEFITGKQPGTFGSPSIAQTVSTNNQILLPIYQRNFTGWYVNYIQNIGSHEQVVVKYDVYDPNSDVSADDFQPTNTGGSTGLTASDIKFSTLGIGFIHHWDENVKFVFYYEIVKNEEVSNITTPSSGLLSGIYPYSSDVKDNVFTFRVQYRF